MSILTTDEKLETKDYNFLLSALVAWKANKLSDKIFSELNQLNIHMKEGETWLMDLQREEDI